MMEKTTHTVLSAVNRPHKWDFSGDVRDKGRPLKCFLDTAVRSCPTLNLQLSPSVAAALTKPVTPPYDVIS